MKVYTKDEVQQLAWWAVAHASKLFSEDRNRVIHKDEIDTYVENEMTSAYGIPNFHENRYDPGLQAIAEERFDQLFTHGRTVEWDIEINDKHQLAYVAVMILAVEFDRTEGYYNEDAWVDQYCPVNWNKEVFRHLLNKPYPDRVKISGALLAGEYSRIKATGDTTTPEWSTQFSNDPTSEDKE